MGVSWVMRPPPLRGGAGGLRIRVRVQIMGSQKYRNVGKSQSVLIMTDPIIFHPHP
jgi:hypothetical protein